MAARFARDAVHEINPALKDTDLDQEIRRVLPLVQNPLGTIVEHVEHQLDVSHRTRAQNTEIDEALRTPNGTSGVTRAEPFVAPAPNCRSTAAALFCFVESSPQRTYRTTAKQASRRAKSVTFVLRSERSIRELEGLTASES